MPNISHLFNSLVNTYRLTESLDSTYSPVSTFELNLSSLKCRVQEKTGFEPVEGGRKYSKVAYVMYCSNSADLVLKDIVEFEDETFSVVDIDFEGNDDTYLHVSLERITVEIDGCESPPTGTFTYLARLSAQYDDNVGYHGWSDDTYLYQIISGVTRELQAFIFDGVSFTRQGDGVIYPIDATARTKQAIWSDGTYIYTSGSGLSGDIMHAYTFDGTTFTEVGSIAGAGYALGMWGDGTYIYTAGWTFLQAFIFDGSNFTKVGETLGDVTGDFAHCYNVCGDGAYLYLAASNDGLIAYEFNGSTFTKKDTVTRGVSACRGVACNDDFIFAGYAGAGFVNGGLSVYTFDGSNFTLITVTDDVSDCRVITVDCRGFRIHGALFNEGVASWQWNGTTLTEIGRVNIGQSGWISSDNTYVYCGLGTFDSPGDAGYDGVGKAGLKAVGYV